MERYHIWHLCPWRIPLRLYHHHLVITRWVHFVGMFHLNKAEDFGRIGLNYHLQSSLYHIHCAFKEPTSAHTPGLRPRPMRLLAKQMCSPTWTQISPSAPARQTYLLSCKDKGSLTRNQTPPDAPSRRPKVLSYLNIQLYWYQGDHRIFHVEKKWKLIFDEEISLGDNFSVWQE